MGYSGLLRFRMDCEDLGIIFLQQGFDSPTGRQLWKLHKYRLSGG